MSEWLKEHAWKACVGETLPWVRIPLSPPSCCYLLRNQPIFSDTPQPRPQNKMGLDRLSFDRFRSWELLFELVDEETNAWTILKNSAEAAGKKDISSTLDPSN